MSGIAQLVGGLSPAGGDVPSISTPGIPNAFDLNALLNLGNDPGFGLGNDPGFEGARSLDQILSMGLSPSDAALVDFFGGQQDVRTRDIYSRLGLGGSTMEAQDLGGNELARLAKSAELIDKDQSLALQDKSLSLQDLLQNKSLSLNNLQGNRNLGLSTQQGTASVNQARANAALEAQRQSVSAQQNAFNQGQTNLRNITGGLGSLASAAGSSGILG